MKNCTFCKIITGDLPSSKIYEDKELLAFLDIQPVNKGHVLVIPKQHKELMTELDDKILGSMIALSKKINQAMRKSDIKLEGINLFLADGEAAGQEVFHAHLHVIPRFKNDGFGFTFPEGYTNKPSRDELDLISQKIQLHLK
ncbi:HIT family protein [Candidatus Peregrinibacteria bacterium CG11_big_fil_rev_8_21_14_0_20_46_8]|nr:MAG: HIT family protein [Candidatus Peregrinibacteria bacterium CG11_big_fil_rev_8_21_14_0_20_46_8]